MNKKEFEFDKELDKRMEAEDIKQEQEQENGNTIR